MSTVPDLPAAAPRGVERRGDQGMEVVLPRVVPLGGLRAMTVRRTLPQRGRSLIGAWCFADHYGPDDVAVTGGMDVPPHPHTGLQTVSWLFTGEVEHRDSLGTHAMVRPGELNLMTAGRGIAHSEVSTPATTVLHGVQLWTALPAAARHGDPAFDHYAPPALALPGGVLRVFLGSLAGSTSPVGTATPLLGAELLLDGALTLPVDPTFEHGVLVDAGPVEVDGVLVHRGELAYLPPGAERLTLRSATPAPARVVLLGGPPFGESVVMWWHFLGGTHDDLATPRPDWQAELAGADPSGAVDAPGGAPRFGAVRGHSGAALPAPDLPGVRLLPRS